MPDININADNSGMNDVRAVGKQLKILDGTIDFDDSYSSGGEDLDMNNYFPKGVIGIIVFPQDGYLFGYDEADKKVKVYNTTTAHAHTENGSGEDTEENEAGPAEEVEDGTDLSEVTGVRFIALGY